MILTCTRTDAALCNVHFNRRGSQRVQVRFEEARESDEILSFVERQSLCAVVFPMKWCCAIGTLGRLFRSSVCKAYLHFLYVILNKITAYRGSTASAVWIIRNGSDCIGDTCTTTPTLIFIYLPVWLISSFCWSGIQYQISVGILPIPRYEWARALALWE